MRVIEHWPPAPFIYPEAIEPTIFLGGPILGAPDWQAEASGILTRTYSGRRDLHICNPRVDGELPHHVSVQTDWEKGGLRRARDYGVIIFWFAAKDDSLPYEEGRAYAQTSRIEFGRAVGWRDYDRGVQIALGIDPKYTGGNATYFRSLAEEGYIDRRIKVHQTLGDVCIDALSRL